MRRDSAYFETSLLAGPDGTGAIGVEKAPLLLLWTTPDFFFLGINHDDTQDLRRARTGRGGRASLFHAP